MADAAVEFLLDNLKQLVVYNAKLINNVRGEVDGLIKDLPLLKAIIEVSTETGREDDVVKALVSRIRDVTFEAEDVIDAYMVVATTQKRKKWLQKLFGGIDHASKLREVAKNVQTIKEEVDKMNNYQMLREALQRRDPARRRRMERRRPDVEKDNVVGFDKAAAKLIDRLTGKTEDLQVISIIGMGGLGKTTLANKVYNDPKVSHEFSTLAWIYVSPTYSKEKLFLSILKDVIQVTSDMSNMGEDELAEEVCRQLTWKYLVIVDDVWEKKDWDSIKKAFPDHKNGSRILLTTRFRHVAVHADQRSPPYELDFLTDDQSWVLLQKKVFDGGDCPQEDLKDDQVNLPPAHVGYIPDEFKLLRVYHIQPISFPRFPSEIEQLVHLTYVAFSGDFKTIPAAVSNLSNLQTLIAETSSRSTRTIDIKADIWKMFKLRHLHTNKPSQLHDPVAKKTKDRDNEPLPPSPLQTLATITPQSCTEGVLGQTPCLKKLGICGKLATLREEKGGSLFDNLTTLEQLVTLKLLNDVFPEPPSESKLQRLPQCHKFPPNLKRLTLADTFLEWEQMHVLGMLPKLEELKLKDNAFTGVRWRLVDGDFQKLKALQIWKTDLVYLEAKADHFPSLQHFVLKDCTRLWEIPSSLGNVKTLQTIKLHQTSRTAADSARKIKLQRQESKVYNGLKVDIFPSDL
ncbi:hypothetical protein RHSIM_Rhsim12G0206900 [Rhododendron simsii]|uniref:Uncharacterized protein n=1 Tax=Rhododendron simsii TaxID=118357 RepID=A0A834G4E2_RHOSS|nr:hypothetical protein RHSIM_Rhsim12G0206900 [Rhododendron simsii]